MEGPPLGPGGENITWPDQVAPRGRKASSTRKIKPQTSNLCPSRRLPLLPLVCGAGAAPRPPPPRRGHPRRLRSRRGGGLAGAGVVGVGGG